MDFEPWPKIPRLRRAILVTEKIDGTNGAVLVNEDGTVQAQSRNRMIGAGLGENAGFAAWVEQNATILAEHLGPGRHFGEWWGVGIQRGYGLRERRFSLFNTKRWGYLRSDMETPEGALTGALELNRIGVTTVPVLASGPMNDDTINHAIDRLRAEGSFAAPGFMKPEGIVVFHLQSQTMFKVLLENDDQAKGAAA